MQRDRYVEELITILRENDTYHLLRRAWRWRSLSGWAWLFVIVPEAQKAMADQTGC